MIASLLRKSLLLVGLTLVTPQAAFADTEIRVMASNLTSGNYQKYESPGIRILQGLDADVVLMQEFNYASNSTADLDSFVDTTFGTEFYWSRESGASIPNGVVSRWPIRQSGEWDDPYMSDRDFAWARIDIPGPKDLWAVSVHFSSKSSSTRASQATSLVSYIKAAGIPSTDYLVVGGDLNTSSRSESCLTTLSQVVVTGSPYPTDQQGDGDTNSLRSSPYDWVMSNTNLNAYKTPTLIGAASYTNGLVFDSRVYTPLSDVYPVQYEDSGASNMQHMGVLKDFLLPSATASDVVVNEIMYAPSSGPEWVELYNPTGEDILLESLLLTDNEGVDTAEGEYWFPVGTYIYAGEYLVLGASTASGVADISWAGTNLALNNLGDQVYLVTDPDHNALFTTAELLDGVSYTSSMGGLGGYSLSRTCIDCDPSLSSSWRSSLTVGGTPGAVNDTLSQ